MRHQTTNLLGETLLREFESLRAHHTVTGQAATTMTSSTITLHDLKKLEGTDIGAPVAGTPFNGVRFQGRWVLREDVMVLLVENTTRRLTDD
jgi:hypothetical protein